MLTHAAVHPTNHWYRWMFIPTYINIYSNMVVQKSYIYISIYWNGIQILGMILDMNYHIFIFNHDMCWRIPNIIQKSHSEIPWFSQGTSLVSCPRFNGMDGTSRVGFAVELATSQARRTLMSFRILKALGLSQWTWKMRNMNKLPCMYLEISCAYLKNVYVL